MFATNKHLLSNHSNPIELFQGDLVLFKPNVNHHLQMDTNTPSNLFVISFECNSEIALKIKEQAYKPILLDNDVIVIACGTCSSLVDDYRELTPTPIFDVITPTVE